MEQWTDGLTKQQTDKQTGGWTEGQTDTTFHRDDVNLMYIPILMIYRCIS